MKILFAGTPEFALPSLQGIHEHSKHELSAVLTNPDKLSGRGRRLQKNPVKRYAEVAGIPILQPERLNADVREAVLKRGADLLAVVAYGKIFGPRFLSLFPRGGVNLHPSLLPQYRGPAPIPAAILAGERESGISIQCMDLKMDAGDILLQEGFEIAPDATTLSLSEYTARRGADLLIQVLDQIEEGRTDPLAQEEDRASYCSLITKEDALMDWNLPAEQIDRAVRAYFPWPQAHTYWEDRKINILSTLPVVQGSREKQEPGRVIGIDKKQGILIQTGEGILAIRRLQLQTKKAMDWQSFIHGNQHIISSLLGG